MVYLLGASLLWAFSFGLIKDFLGGVDPILVAAGRLVLAAALFTPFLGRVRVRGKDVPLVLGLGGIQFGLMYVLYLMSYAWLPAWLVALMTVFTPLYVVALYDFRERCFRVRHLIAALVAVTGAGVVLAKGLPAGADWRGLVLLQGANICFAVGQVFYGDLKHRLAGDDVGMMAWMYQGAALVVLLATVVIRPDPGGWTISAGAVLVYLGLVPTAAGFYLWNKGAGQVSGGRLAVTNNLKVPLAVLVAWFVFGEAAPYGRALIGMALLVGGLWIASPEKTGRN